MKLNLENFKAPDLDEWRSKIIAETGSNKKHLYHNAVEGIEIDTTEKTNTSNFDSDCNDSLNDWDVGTYYNVTDASKTNQFILKCLAHGANELYLNIQSLSPNWSLIFNEIHLEYIHIVLAFSNHDQLNSFFDYLPGSSEKNFSVAIDPINPIGLDKILESNVSISINGFNIEQVGAKASDQLSLLLYFGESILHSIKDETRIRFELGIGSDFFLEISKIRALKWLWSHLLNKNNRETSACTILARIGWSNKSLKDPDINILRQTTEALSAISGGVNSVLIHSSHSLSDDQDNWLYQRMALNISHILKEESYLSKVNDPLRGSFIIEQLTGELISKSWDDFLHCMDCKHIDFIKEKLTTNISVARELKTIAFDTGEKQLLGINLYPSEVANKLSWIGIPDYLGFDYLIFENR